MVRTILWVILSCTSVYGKDSSSKNTFQLLNEHLNKKLQDSKYELPSLASILPFRWHKLYILGSYEPPSELAVKDVKNFEAYRLRFRNFEKNGKNFALILLNDQREIVEVFFIDRKFFRIVNTIWRTNENTFD